VSSEPSFVVAVDSGGTFSDCVVIAADGSTTTGKAASTPPDFSRGVLDAVASAAEQLGLSTSELLERSVLFAHGTTVATNALLTRTGSPTGLITTRGHEDAVIIGRTFQKVAGLTEAEMTQVSRLSKPAPIAPRELIAGIDERIDARGEVVVALDEASLETAAARLLSLGAESIAVSLLWSFLNPVHEHAVRAWFERNHPDIPVSLSSDLAPVIREYERGITVTLNGYLLRQTSEYLRTLVGRLRDSGYGRQAVVMQSSGGVMPIERARTHAVTLLTSGPAGGVMAAKALADRLGDRDVITTDVGGTSFDVGLIVDGQPQFAESPIFAQFQLVTPMIDVATIGAGGGSIAWIEPETGLLRVGPQSAGADPGPACYGRGGSEPTVTDANVVLGRLNPDYFLGGRQTLDADASFAAIGKLGSALGMSEQEAALAVARIADAHMTDLIRRVSVERGYDPRRFVIYAFGGAGPPQAGSFGAGLGVKRVVIPALASEFSAFGIGASDLLVVSEASDPCEAPFEVGRLESTFAGLEQRAAAELAASGVAADHTTFQRFARLRYVGQVHELRVPVPRLNGSDQPLLEEFQRRYEGKYGSGAAYREAGIQALTFIVHAFGRLNHPALDARGGGASGATEPVATREVVFREGALATRVYRAEDLGVGARLEGPAIVEARTTTTVVFPGQTAELDELHNLVVDVSQASR
jgi:N-methylhydantoinase A